jgi:hypothetical protein
MMMKEQRVNFTANSFVPSQQRGAGYQGENLEIVSNLEALQGITKIALPQLSTIWHQWFPVTFGLAGKIDG